MRLLKFIISIILIQNSAYAQYPTPKINKNIVDYVSTVIGKKVDRGECWDLANRALTKANAKWDHEYKYGIPVDPLTDNIFPGDLIQFENVVLKYEKGGRHFKENMAHHTGIIYKVTAKGEYQIAHQNNGQHGRKVGLSDFKLVDITKGKAFFYRPEEN